MRILLSVALLGVALAVVAGEAADLFWLFELAVHFRPHLLAAAALFVPLAGLVGMWWRPVWWAALATAGINAARLEGYANVPFAAPAIPPAQAAAVAPKRILWANLQNWSTDLAAFRRLLEEERPDIAALTELAAIHEPVLDAMRGALPHRTALPTNSAFDILILSRTAPASVRRHEPIGPVFPILEARFCDGAGPCLAVLALHAPRPGPGETLRAGGLPGLGDTAHRDRQLDRAAALARERIAAGERVVLVGDFNCTPFSPVFARLVASSGLRDTAAVDEAADRRGWRWIAPATWQWPIGLMIDHALVDPATELVVRRLGAAIGSDHRPLVIDLAPRRP